MRVYRLIILLIFLSISQSNIAQVTSAARGESSNKIVSNTITQADKAQISLTSLGNKTDSTLNAVAAIPVKYYKQAEKKITKYSDRITSKTEKTLTKLSKWENKIKVLLDKASPATSAKLFGNNQQTFTTLLQKVKAGENLVAKNKTVYDEYRDKLSSGLRYVQTQKNKLDSNVLQPAGSAAKKIDVLDQDVANSEEVQRFIKERKKQLMNESVKYIGKSKYFKKINKESYYYVETLKNYKEVFSDKKKAEETALHILNDIPAFKKFMQQNGQLAALFGTSTSADPQQALAGLQTRAGINDMIQGRIAAGGPNAAQLVQANMVDAKSYITQLKDKALKNGLSNSDQEIPEFKPNEQKTKTFFQRLEYGADFQSQKAGKYFPTTSDISLSVAYKLNDKSHIGIGASYKIGWGTGFDKIRVSSQGIGIRSFIDWKIKKSYFITGGYEQNYRTAFSNTSQLNNINNWQQAALIGLSKKYKINSKLKGNIQVLYDFLSKSHTPVSQPFVYRIGYNF